MTGSLTATATELTENDRSRMELHLQAHLRGRVHDLRLELTEIGVVLRGRSRTYHGKQLAQHLLISLCRMPLAANQIDVS